jgi:hypothetical protein
LTDSDWLVTNNIVARVQPEGLSLVLNMMEKGMAEAKRGIEQAGPEAQPALMYFNFMNSFIAGARNELSAVSVGLQSPEEGGLDVSIRGAVKDGGMWSRMLDAPAADRAAVLSGLPAMPYFMAFGMVMQPGMTEKMIDLSVAMIEASSRAQPNRGLTDDQRRRLRSIYSDAMKTPIESSAAVFGLPARGESMVSRVVGITRVANVKGYLVEQRKYTDELSKLMAEIKMQGMPAITTSDTKIAGRDAIEMIMDMSKSIQLPPNVDAEPAMAMFEKMFGPGGKMTMLYAPLDEKTIVAGYGRESIEKYLKSPPPSNEQLATDPQLSKTADRLPPGAQCLGFLNGRGFVNVVNGFISGMPQTQGFQLPEFPSVPPLGAAVKTNATGLEVGIVVPSDTIAAMGNYVTKVRAMGQQKPPVP